MRFESKLVRSEVYSTTLVSLLSFSTTQKRVLWFFLSKTYPAPIATAATPRYRPAIPSALITELMALKIVLDTFTGQKQKTKKRRSERRSKEKKKSVVNRRFHFPLAEPKKNRVGRGEKTGFEAVRGRPTWLPGVDIACIRVLIVSTGNIAMCSAIPASDPAIMNCKRTTKWKKKKKR